MRPVILVLLLVASACAERVQHKEDPIFIMQCCVDRTIPRGGGGCTDEFCDATVKGQAEKYEGVELDKSTPEELTEDHRKGEAFGAQEWLARLLESEILVAGVGEESVTTVAEADAVAMERTGTSEEVDNMLALEKSGRLHAMKARVHRAMQKKRSRTRVPFDTAIKWPLGELRYKLHSSVTADEESAKKTLKQFSDGIAKFHEHTCVRFIHDNAGVIEFKQSAHGSFTNDLGNKVTSINLSKRSSDLNTALHEMGHALGLEHTHVRSDRDTYIDYDAAACRADFLAKECANPDTDSPRHHEVCSNPAYKDYLISTLRLPATYTHTNPGMLAKCKTEWCIYGWLAQYQLSASPIHADYDFGSIMHYYFDGCISAKPDKLAAAERQEPQVNGLTPVDIEVINKGYECRAIKLKHGETTHTIHIHPQVPFATFKHYIAERLAIPNLDGKVVKSGETALTDTCTLASRTIESGAELVISAAE